MSSQICICCNSSKFWALRVPNNSFFLSVLGFCKGFRKRHPEVLGGLHDPRPGAVVRGEGGGGWWEDVIPTTPRSVFHARCWAYPPSSSSWSRDLEVCAPFCRLIHFPKEVFWPEFTWHSQGSMFNPPVHSLCLLVETEKISRMQDFRAHTAPQKEVTPRELC